MTIFVLGINFCVLKASRSKISSGNVTFCPYMVKHTKKSESARSFYY